MINQSVLDFDCAAEIVAISDAMRSELATVLHRRGFVVAMSGGIDSSVCAALAVNAVGASRVFGLLLPERDSAAESSARGRILAEQLGIRYEICDIAPTLDAIGCYRWRDEAIRHVVPEYAVGWRNKIVIRGGVDGGINRFELVVESPDGIQLVRSLRLADYLQIVAATNFKQRIRKTIEYAHADRLNFAVVGTPNRLEYDQGFFVKNGDGAADIKPIAHLYKSQVYALARFMHLPKEICEAEPTTDTYSLAQGQDEFYFGLPYPQMDLALWGFEHGIPTADIASALGVTIEQVVNIYADIERKRKTTSYLHHHPIPLRPLR